jgi:hypothetical protein
MLTFIFNNVHWVHLIKYKPNEDFEGYNRVKTQLGKQFELSCCNFLNYKRT